MNKELFSDVCVGEARFSNFGKNVEFEIWSTYDGRTLAKVLCVNAKSISIQNPYADEENEELFGAYIALVRVEELELSGNKKDYKLILESGTVWIEVICQTVMSHENSC
jgi:hypothetical protein